MEDLTLVFKALLKYFLPQFKTQRQFASKIGIQPSYLNGLLKGRRPGDETVRRQTATALGYPGRKYEDFLELGRYILAGKDPETILEDQDGLSEDEMRERGFISVPFSDNMRLSTDSGGTIEVTEDATRSRIIIHGPSLKRTSARHLQAFMVAGDSMEPIIAQGGIVVADLRENDPARLEEGKIYVICWDLQLGECAVKYLRWAKQGESILIMSPDSQLHPPIVRRLRDIQLIGRVIWSWREH
jgi:transcriptional regulator with XRE-family HTH domain